MKPTTISKKRKFVGDGVFKAELIEFLTREFSEDGYSGVEVRVILTRTRIIIMATRTDRVLGEKNRRIQELTSVVQKRFSFSESSVVLYGEKVANRGLCAIAHKVISSHPSSEIKPVKLEGPPQIPVAM